MIARQMGEFERWASGIASTAVGSWGMRRGGVVGLLALAGAGFLAWRASTGRSLLPEGGRQMLEKAIPALAHESESKAPARRRAPAKTKPAASTARRPAASRTAATKSAAPKAKSPAKASAQAAEKTAAAKPRAPRRKTAPVTTANGSAASTGKTIN